MAKLSKEAQEQMKLAGYDLSDVEGGDLDDHEADTTKAAQTAKPSAAPAGLDPQQAPATEPQQEPGLAPSTEETEQPEPAGQPDESTEPQKEEQPDPNAKTWQSKYDKTVADLHKEKEEKAHLAAEKEALLAVLSGVGGTAVATAPQVTPVQPAKKPQLWDFIKQDQYDPYDALNPATLSGQAKEKYDEALTDWRTEQNLRKHEQAQLQKRMQETAMKQATALAAKHSEFRNPLTRQPDMQKIAQFMDELSNSDDPELWAELYEWRKQRKNGKPATAPPAPDLNQIGRSANKVSSVTSQSAAEKEKKAPPKSVSNYSKVYGAGLEIPADAELE